MPCMKDYGVTWDENGPIATDMVLKVNDGRVAIGLKRREFPRYKRIANQYGVAKFKRIN